MVWMYVICLIGFGFSILSMAEMASSTSCPNARHVIDIANRSYCSGSYVRYVVTWDLPSMGVLKSFV